MILGGSSISCDDRVDIRGDRMAEVYSVHAVFTPTTQVRVNFVQRSSVNDRLVDALMTPGKQLVVYGESGSGKSTLLLKKQRSCTLTILQPDVTPR